METRSLHSCVCPCNHVLLSRPNGTLTKDLIAFCFVFLLQLFRELSGKCIYHICGSRYMGLNSSSIGTSSFQN